MKMRQSAASWFQRASRTSAPTSSSSDGVSDCLTVSRGSEVAMAGIVMGVLANARHAARDPVGGPIDEPAERNARITEQARGLGGIDEPSLGGFDAGEDPRVCPRPALKLAPGGGWSPLPAPCPVSGSQR